MTNKGITRAKKPEVQERVTVIADLMRSLSWRRGVTNRELASKWNVSLDAVNDYAATASHVVRSEVTNPEEVSGTVATTLAENLRRASDAAEFGDVAKIADVWTRIVGARAPEKVEHTVYAAMQPPQMLEHVQAQIRKLQAVEARLLAQLNVVQALPDEKGE